MTTETIRERFCQAPEAIPHPSPTQAARIAPDAPIDIVISEVGPRDGLQNIKRVMPTADKIRWVQALAGAGLREIEVASFVPPKMLPQMADAAEVVHAAGAIPALRVLALAPNLRGAQSAVAAGVHTVSMPVSASRAHSMANLRKTPEEAVEEVRRVREFLDSLPAASAPSLEVGISTAFGCSIQGFVDEKWVMELAAMLAAAGVDSVGLSDGVGYANPVQVRRMFTTLRSELGGKAGAAHFHNTFGQGLANVIAALEVGVTTFDSSQGGIGGCPYSPGASGNIVTEDLVFLLESMGLKTGIDIDRLVAARTIILEGLPGERLYGHVPDAGLPKVFHYAT
jgi:hydroxymethylglutaryl-CoA lyase